MGCSGVADGRCSPLSGATRSTGCCSARTRPGTRPPSNTVWTARRTWSSLWLPQQNTCQSHTRRKPLRRLSPSLLSLRRTEYTMSPQSRLRSQLHIGRTVWQDWSPDRRTQLRTVCIASTQQLHRSRRHSWHWHARCCRMGCLGSCHDHSSPLGTTCTRVTPMESRIQDRMRCT